MKAFYLVPTTTLAAAKPRGAWHAIICPGATAWSLCVVEYWNDDTADDEWETLPNIQALHPENWGNVVPAAAVTAFGPWGVLPTDTIRQAMRKVRAAWSHARQD
jgi:hypothetical protein